MKDLNYISIIYRVFEGFPDLDHRWPGGGTDLLVQDRFSRWKQELAEVVDIVQYHY